MSYSGGLGEKLVSLEGYCQERVLEVELVLGPGFRHAHTGPITRWLG